MHKGRADVTAEHTGDCTGLWKADATAVFEAGGDVGGSLEMFFSW